ncbi:hypothetical protein FRC11_012071 [Ceratobasidium sp. 423]|nr:hypothetical protein FRC11_012071 [Ceratobasidium sp. 423]
MYGSSEIAGILYAMQAPYTHLRIPAGSPPLVTPIVNSQSDGSLQVQLWHSLSTSPQLAHLYAKGGVPLKFEPFPGPGPHEGEPAVNLGDIFELVRLPPGSGAEFAYVHLGRSDDFVKLSGGVGWIFNVAPYESRIRSLVCSCQPGWTVDGVQLFGTGLPCATLVIQLSGDTEGQERRTNFLEDLGNLVERANKEFKLGPGQRVHTRKRLLVITPDKVWGPESRYIQENRVRLSMTHKHTLQRWKNVQAFQAWCNRLDFSEP